MNACRSPIPMLCSLRTGLAILLHSGLNAQEPSPISDNSFLIEEAYNQEPGVVQHISTFSRPDGGEAWAYSFTQEWPLRGVRNQLSYTVPVLHEDGPGTGLGDIALNYRYQLLGGDGSVHAAPRLSVLLPTGSERRGRGTGSVGFQSNLPVSAAVTPKVITHWNAGLTLTPSAGNALGHEATTTSYNLGASAIWLLRPNINLMVELLWLSEEEVVGPDQTTRIESLLLNPGVRWAFNFENGLQIVPGVAYTFGLEQADDDGLFLYLSFEHPFRH